MQKIIIGIQARSTSERFPGKVFAEIDGKEILQHVVDAAETSCLYINKYSARKRLRVQTVILCPYGDDIATRYKHQTIIFEGPELDVLKRYHEMSTEMDADFIVRVTADCPLLPSYLISKCINIAINGRYDYVSNVDPRSRTCVDGHDVEVMSRRALNWAHETANTPEDREHVTTILRSHRVPHSFSVAHVIGQLDLGKIKLSVDTPEDLEIVKKTYFQIKEKIDLAASRNGIKSVYRI